jgi:hypothetical protein
MSVKVIKVNRVFKVVKFLIYLVLLIIISLIFFPNAAYADTIFKILFVFVLVLGVVRLFTTSFSVIGRFEYSHDRLKLVIGEMSKEIEINKINRMSIIINSYKGKPVGLSLRTHHGSDNKVDMIADGHAYSFLFQLQSRQDLNSFEGKRRSGLRSIKILLSKKVYFKFI